MSVTGGVSVAEREDKLRQVERIVGSDLLHGSESLCKLLRYLAEHCIDHPGVGVKEYEIATELFKRPGFMGVIVYFKKEIFAEPGPDSEINVTNSRTLTVAGIVNLLTSAANQFRHK